MRIAVAGGTGLVGRYTVEAVQGAGHTAVVLSRSSGVDLLRDAGVAAALEGVDLIIDTTNSARISGAKAAAFFTEVTTRLQRLGAAQKVSRLVTLSIVGVDRVPGNGYYQAKLRQEEAALAGPLPATIVRATQFHEFPAQLLSRTRLGPVAIMPRMRIQPVAARTAAEFLLEMAVQPPPAGTVEIAGPSEEELVRLARSIVRRRDRRLLVLPLAVPGSAGRAMRRGAQLASPGARISGPTFAEWLAGSDSQAVPF